MEPKSQLLEEGTPPNRPVIMPGVPLTPTTSTGLSRPPAPASIIASLINTNGPSKELPPSTSLISDLLGIPYVKSGQGTSTVRGVHSNSLNRNNQQSLIKSKSSDALKLRRTYRNFPSCKTYSSASDSRTCLKRRILRRKKRRFKSLLHDISKELITQYLCTLIKNSPVSSMVDELKQEAKTILVRPTNKFREFFRAHSAEKLADALYRQHGDTDDENEDRTQMYFVTETVTPREIQPNRTKVTMVKVPEVPVTIIPSAEAKKIINISPKEVNRNKKSPTPISVNEKLRLVACGEGDFTKKKSVPKPPKKYSEKMKAEASILQRIGELQKEGMWYDKRLPKVKEPDRRKTHWDYVLEEAIWMNMDFQQERKWKQVAAKKISKAIRRHFAQKELAAQRAVKEEEIRRRRVASFLAREIQNFWGNVKRVLELREQSRIEELRKKAMDQQLSFIVDQTEKYSDLLAEKFQSVLKNEASVGGGSENVSDLESVPPAAQSDGEFEPKSESDDDEETIAKAEEETKGTDISNEVELLQKESHMELDDLLDDLPPGYIEETIRELKNEEAKFLPPPGTSLDEFGNVVVEEIPTREDVEFNPPSDDSDYERTIDEEEMKEEEENVDHANEIKELEAENELTIEEIIEKYSGYRGLTEDEESAEEKGYDSDETIVSDEESNNEEDDSNPSSTETESEEDDIQTADLIKENENESELASLLKTFAPERAAEADNDAALNSVAALAESFQPKGYTLSSTKVVTTVPPLIKHTLREYQHIGLDWLVTMYEKRLNGILADEMGLGKTIQTISLLAHLAYEKANWGPHLIVVPTSVMLNWEMEFKKWCPGFKILTYYGSQKERKLKRTGWTKANSFHVCITSYKLVIQDHQSFRRKRWKYLILDEAQNIKNFKSQRWQLLLNFNAQRRLLLTGTPLQNNLMELWSLMHFLMPNVFQSHREFREWFSNPVTGMVEGSAEYNENIIRRLHKVLRPFILRRLKCEVEKQLPKKYEHLVMCRLSKRQRFLYEEFMSRTRTKETLNAGNLLSVINVLMQLRKVCNHPNLFEPRPVISPLQSDGITYVIPSLVWNILDDILENTPSYPVFRMTEDDLHFSKHEAWRIRSLMPTLGSDEEDKENHRRKNVFQTCSSDFSVTLRNRSNQIFFKEMEKVPPMKRRKWDIVGVPKAKAMPPMPRLNAPLQFFMTTVDPVAAGLLEDPEFVQCVSQGAPPPQKKSSFPPVINGGIQVMRPKVEKKKQVLEPETDKEDAPEEKKAKLDPIDDEDSDENESNESGDDSDAEILESTIKRKVPVAVKLTGTDGILAMGYNPVEFELAVVFLMSALAQGKDRKSEIQRRSINNKTAVLSKLQKLNVFRCEKNPVYGTDIVESCELFATTNHGRRLRYTGSPKVLRLEVKDAANRGKFLLGYGQVERVIRAKLNSSVNFLPNHPHLLANYTSSLMEMVLTLEERIETLKDVLNRFVIYVPAVAVPMPQCKVFRPSQSRYCKQLYMERQLKENLSKPSEVLHHVFSSMSTQFPDPRLIQYDCGKLQTLDRLLRQLKAGSHRVLIFTQMARMLDVLEAFLNYHGHIYLRLDGATKIDQRQILMERFNTDKRIFCFILSTRSGGIGVNLTGADTVIFYDSDWNPTMDAQAQDRCHRIGQTRDVHIYRLVSEKTIEENILKKSNQKRMLGELAIEGGNFTTAYFTKNTIHDLFNVDQQESDPKKRLAELTSDIRAGEVSDKKPTKEMSSSLVAPSEIIDAGTSEEKAASQMLECALLAAEDETDVQAARTVRAEAAAELAEFDETISLDELDNVTPPEELPKSEIEEIFDQLNPVELYAVSFMEHCLEDWTTETYANAQKDIEKQKQEWEDAQLRHLQDLEDENLEEEDSDDDEIITYLSIDAMNQVWMAQDAKNEIIMPIESYGSPDPVNWKFVSDRTGALLSAGAIWCPPTPPQDDSDVYLDTCYGYLYNQEVIPESQLPSVYIPPKYPKKPVTPTVTPKPGYERPVEFPVEVSEAEEPPASKKSPKVQRRDDPIFAPRSLFDRPSPALAKLRRDYRLQKYSGRPTSTPIKGNLGPGSISFPIIPPASAKPPPPAPPDMVEWLVAEDFALLQTVSNMLELPLSLLVVNLAQTPNWDLAAEMVNMTSRTYRTPKQCKWRYENIIGPREEGKLFYETPALSPSSPAAKKKKAKAFIKIAPPSPSKAARYLKTSQLMTQDNNTQFTSLFNQKFDAIKSIASKRTPTTKQVNVTPTAKTSKQAGIFTEHGINYDNPLPATSIAQTRMDRVQLERKKAIQQQQATTQTTVPSVVTAAIPQAPSSISQALASQPASPTVSSPSSPDTTGKLTRGVYPSASTASLVPLVLGPNTNVDALTRTGVIPTSASLTGPQKRQVSLTSGQVQQQYIIQQKLQQAQQQSQIQQSLSNSTTNIQQGIAVATQQPTASLQVAQNVLASQQAHAQQLLRTSQQQVQQQTHTQTVVLTPGLAQALGAAVGATVSVAPAIPSQPLVVSTAGTASALTKNAQAVSQQQVQRMSTVTMQDITSAATVSGVQQQSPQTIVSLTPMTSQMTTKLIQGTQGLTTFVQAAPRPSGITPLNQPVQANKMSPIQLQYLRQGALIRQQPATAATASQQQALQAKEQAQQQQQLQQQLKRIQVVTSSAAPNIGTPQALGMGLSNVTVVHSASGAIFTQAAASSGVTASTLTAAQKAVPVMTLTSGSTTLGGLTTVVSQGPRQLQILRNDVLGMMNGQLVKQQQIGGKMITRPVTDAEVAAILKQHGLAQQQGRLSVTSQGAVGQVGQLQQTSQKSPQITSFPVSTHTLLTSMGIQNVMKVQPSTAGQPIATIVKSAPVNQQVGQQQGGTLTFPLLSQVKTVNKLTGPPAKQQTQVQQITALQQTLLRRQQQQQLQTGAGSKMTHITQVSQGGNMPTQLIVQTAPKQLQGGVSVPQFQQIFKQVTASGQVIGQGGPVIHTHMLTKSASGAPNIIAVTTTSNPQILTGSSQQSNPMNIAGTLVAPSPQNVHARLVPVNAQSGIKPTIQVMTAGPGTAILGTGTLARPQVPGATPSSTYPTIKLSGTLNQGQPVSIRLQTSGTVAGAPDTSVAVPCGTLTTVSVAAPGASTSGSIAIATAGQVVPGESLPKARVTASDGSTPTSSAS